jgi:hypothetical protein
LATRIKAASQAVPLEFASCGAQAKTAAARPIGHGKLGQPPPQAAPGQRSDRPNILMILSDDMVSCTSARMWTLSSDADVLLLFSSDATRDGMTLGGTQGLATKRSSLHLWTGWSRREWNWTGIMPSSTAHHPV